MDGNSNDASDNRGYFGGVLFAFAVIFTVMVAHFVCILFTAFIIYTAQPGTSKL